MYKPLGLDHVVLTVRDQAKSRQFYEDVLGCTLAKFNERISLIHLRFGEALIDLLPATGGGAGRARSLLPVDPVRRPQGGRRVAARRKGVAVEGDVVQRFGAWGDGPSIYLRDPDGHMIELKPRP